MNQSITLESPRSATQEERATISQIALAQEKRSSTSGEPDPTQEEVAEREAYYAEALMQVYPIQGSTARLCLVASRTLPFYEHGKVFGWDYAVWLCTAQGNWQPLDTGDSHLPQVDVFLND